MGSTSYITTRNGSISQHVEYIAFGEVLFEEHSSSFSSPYLFNGKELDRETNFSYYGARYLDIKTSLWLSVDPLAEKYPNMSPYVYCANNPIMFIDPDGKDWYLNDETGDYQWYKGSGKHTGYTNVGENRVSYNSKLNRIEVYHQNESSASEIISMDTNQDKKGNFLSYKTDRAAKFAMASAELGGSGNSTQFDALVISASKDNRLAALNSGNYSKYDIEHSGLVDSYDENGYSIQDLFTPSQYQSAVYPAYQDFSYGHSRRFKGEPFNANLSLVLTYNAMDNPVSKLENGFKFTKAKEIMSYSHKGGGNPSLFKSYKIDFNQSVAPNMKNINGSKFWKR